ncbi:ciliogenesis and planar polarity effector 1 isoform X2 [Coturnix japonica]|uniref:ciliogenesis and planar polarity effector 1 isoform X2 n=1 Tax=Coturnix japonica TaxID=93934 RepID=UPI0013A5DC26|nr:ciliogenesis and planar polarity effector 1 isoform X2 [Coturnix japonica]
MVTQRSCENGDQAGCSRVHVYQTKETVDSNHLDWAGAWLAGLLTTGELFLWNKDQDCLKVIPAIDESRKITAAAQECLMRLYLYVSGDGRRVLLTTPTACVFLWESTEYTNTLSYKNSSGRWTQILPSESIMLPSTEEKEIGVHASFIQNEVLGDCCLCSFVFYSGECLVLTFLILRWHENGFKFASSLPYQIHWVQQTCSLVNLVPQCVSIKSRGALLSAFARDGLFLAVAVNQIDPKATQILFLNTLNFLTVSGSVKGCSSKSNTVPSKFIRSYWVGDMSWTPDSLFLACMLKRGSLILLTGMGELLTLITSGCSVEFGPAEFIPIHPLITYRQHSTLCQDSSQTLGSSASESDIMRQRFSVASHSRLPYLIVSDGFMITVLRFHNNVSPVGFLRSLLLDSTQRLETVRRNLMNSQSKGRHLCLRSLLSLKDSLLKHTQNHTSNSFSVPKFLEEDTTERNQKTTDLLDYENESDDEKLFPNSSSSIFSQRVLSSVGKADQGHIEFASMFDTIHAEDDTEEKDKLSVELNSVQRSLLTAWQIGISKNIEERDTFLNYTVSCISHFFNILQFVECSSLYQDAFLNKSVKNSHWIHCVLRYFKLCLSVLHWHSRAGMTGHVAKLTLQTLKLMLVQKQDQLFSKNLLACFCLLKMVSHTLSSTCIPQYENLFVPGVNSLVELDSFIVPILLFLDESATQEFSSLKSLLRKPPQALNCDEKTEKRLIVLWRFLYKRVVCYWILLNKKAYKSSEEETIVSLLLSHVQAILQSSGVILEQHYKINSIAGEEKFLLGSYGESVDVWKRCLCEIKAKGGKRACFLQSRYYLALLFCHLYHYNLCEAQGLCDHLVGEILRRSQLSVSQMEDFSDTKYSQHELWMLTDVHTETAMAVIRSMARFMAAYFTNQLLYIFPPHNVDILHPLHIKPDTSPRIIPLQHHLVTRAVRDQNLSSVWTVVYALDLFFVGGLIPEAVWLTHRLGDWKLSVSIGVAYTLYCQNSDEFTRLKITEHHLPLSLSPVQTFQEKLQSLLGQPATSETTTEEHIKYKQFTDPIEEEDADVLYSSVQELLKAAVMADADILSETFQLLIDSVKDLSRKFCGLIPDGLYLPAPPLYCPQPASLSEEDCNDFILKTERENRQKVSGVLQRIILLFRASSCSCPAAQWYISQLKRGRKVMQKIRMKGSLPSLSPFPDTLLRYCNFRTTFCSESTSSGDHQLDDISCKILGWFRELCALCWMLHVRERLSDSCRRYQAARENANIHKDLKKNECDASTVEHCLNAAEWACRMLPFCRFMNVEELVQDIILSLLGELPPIRKVAEIFVKAFPNPEDVRVPLRDKYHSLQQRLRHCTVQGPESDKMMSVVIQALEKARMKNLRLVIRNIGPIEINVWEPAEEGADYQEQHYYDRDSLGTSISRSTLTELGNPQLHSEAETVDTLSDALLDEETRFHTPLPQRESEYQRQGEIGSKNATCKTKVLTSKTKHMEKAYRKDTQNQYSLPVVGAWEFERDDEEYVNFLELFLSYVLEKDLLKYNDHRIPFLTSFSGLLQKHELNSLFFEIHTTLKRRQAKTRSQSVFRAGSCYTVTLTSYNPETVSVHGISQNVLENPNIVQSTIQAAEPSVHNTNKELKGLFGLKRNSIYRAQSDNQEVTIASASQIVPKDNSCTLQTLTTSKYVYKTAHFPDTVPGEELAIELTGKFSNIARLLEWMIRWSDRRLLHGSKKQDSIEEGPPMIRVKTSAAAVITSLWLLEQLCKDGKQARSVTFKNTSNECLKESTPLSEAQPTSERKYRVDEGTSASPPADVNNVQAYDILCEDGFGMSTKSKCFDKKEIKHGNCCLPHVTEDLSKVEPFLQEESDLTSQIEEFFEEPFETPKSSNSSVRIKPGKNIFNSAVNSLQEDQKMKKAEERKAEQNVMTEVAASTISQSFSLEQNSEVPSNIEISVSHGQPSLAAVSSLSSIISSTSICAKKEDKDIRKEVTTEEKQNTSETVRHMLQDEMFKLVQLQQINFMSLMQIVQSSFVNLPNVQQTLQQYQCAHLEGIQPVPPAAVNGSGRPSCSAGASLKTQLSTEDNRGKHDQKSSNFQPTDSLRDESNSVHTKNQQNVSLSLPESQSREAGFMPPSQDLHSSAPIKPFHLLAPSSDVQKAPKFIPIEKNRNYSDGFPLLKLESVYHSKPAFLHPKEVSSTFARPPPVLRVAWNSSNSLWNQQSLYQERSKSTAHVNMSRSKPEISKQIQGEEKRWAETVNKPPSKHLCSSQYEEQEISLEQQFSGNVKMDNTMITNNLSGIPLLHLNLDPVPRLPQVIKQPITTALIPVKPVTKETDCRETLQHTGISLLHANLPQQKKVPKLIPPQDLIAFEQYYYHHNVTSSSFGQDQTKPMQLLKTDLKPFEPRDVQKSTKRQKRRDKKQMKEEVEKEKRSVSFCPEDSIINISDTVMAVETKVDPETKCTSYLQDDSFIPMDKATEAVTTPELHASTNKNIAETQDASTNTHPVLKSHKDIGISTETEISDTGKNESDVSVPVSESPRVPKLSSPNLYLNLGFSSEVKERLLPSSLSDVPDLTKHRYVSVTDIEGSDILNDLHVVPESADEIVTTEQNEKFEIPSTAELHHTAASVTNAIPSELLQKKDNHLKDVSSQKQKEHKETDSARESVTWNTELQDTRAFPSTRLLPKVTDKKYLSVKHQEIDLQLRILQNVTKNMEKDFRNTRQLVKIIEDLETADNSDPHDHPSFSEDSRISDDEYLKGIIFEDVMDGEKKSLKLERPVTRNTTLKVNSAKFTDSASDFSDGIKSCLGFNLNDKLSESSVEDPLQITGFSGVTDMVNKLVLEGGISPTELGFPKTQAKKISRHSQKTEKEKKEIRAWMKRKQKERMREYMKKLEEQRQKEHNPFDFKKNAHCRLTSKDIKLLQKKKEEKDRIMFSEHHSMRVSQALSLVNEVLSETLMFPASERRQWSSARSPQECRKQHIVSTKGGHPNIHVMSERNRIAARPCFGQKGRHFTPALGSTRSKAAECRVSRISTTNKTKQEQQKHPGVSTAVQTEGFDHETDGDVESPWTAPDEIQGTLQDSHDTLFQDSAPHTVSFSPVSNNDTDGISESTGSFLSRLDWNAIEALVADVEDT